MSCAQCCMCLWIVHSWLPYGFCSLDCSFLIDLWFLFSGLFILDCPMVFVLWIVHSWLTYGFRSLDYSFLIAVWFLFSGLFILDCPMLHVSLDCSFVIALWFLFLRLYRMFSVFTDIFFLYSHSYSNEVYNRVVAWSPMVQRTDEVIVYVDVCVPYFVC